MNVDGLQEFGFVRIEAAFSREQADAMQAVLWHALRDVHGIRADDPTTWTLDRVTKLQAIKEHPVFEPIGAPRVRAAIDALLDNWTPPRQWGGFLVSFPRDETWNVPAGEWHPDYHFYYEPQPLFGLGVFSYLDDVPAGSGGTVVIERSHRWVAHFVTTRSAADRRDFAGTKRALFDSHPWLRDLQSGAGSPDQRRRTFMAHPCHVDGVELRVTELSGRAGDVVLMHPWTLHSFAPNCGRRPRFMRVFNLYGRQAIEVAP